MNFTKLSISTFKNDFLQLVYPQNCYGCGTELVGSKAGICPVCTIDLEYTLFENYQEASALDKLFWGRVTLIGTYSLLYFAKTGVSQQILHQLKYNSRKDLGAYYGAEIGKRIQTMENFKDVVGLIPVPLHPKKQFIRGYNQAEELAKGVAEETRLPIRMDLLKRTVFSESQTKKGLLSRWDSMQNIFNSTKQGTETGHFVLIDDVITTGATLEVCAREILKNYPGIKLSVASLAVAK
jgi:ComF family protein